MLVSLGFSRDESRHMPYSEGYAYLHASMVNHGIPTEFSTADHHNSDWIEKTVKLVNGE